MTKKLTGKQQKFAELIVQGCSVADAMRGAGYQYQRPEDVANEGYRLLHHPDIAPMIEAARAEAMRGAVVTRQTLIQRLETVNKALFDMLTADDAGQVDIKAYRAFHESFDRLLRLVPDDGFYQVANDELTARNSGDWTKAVFDDAHVWFNDGGSSLPGSWDSETVEPLPGGGVKMTRKRIR